MTTPYKLTISAEQDGMGYFYGTFDAGGEHVYRVDILPPASEPRPYFVLGNERMHPTEWIIFLDGEEVARVCRRDDIEPALANHIAA